VITAGHAERVGRDLPITEGLHPTVPLDPPRPAPVLLRMNFDPQPHVANLAQLESMQDRLLIELEDLDRRVLCLLRKAQVLRAKNSLPTPEDPHRIHPESEPSTAAKRSSKKAA